MEQVILARSGDTSSCHKEENMVQEGKWDGDGAPEGLLLFSN